jgi:lysozyme
MTDQVINKVLVSEILNIGLPLIKRFEGLRLKPYLCSAGVPTIGYGSTYYINDLKVSLSDKEITKEVAEELLRYTVIKTYLPAVLSLCPTLDSPQKFAAILSWTYNLGVGALKSSTMRKKILQKDWTSTIVELKKWNKAAGKELAGLTIRRSAEAAVFQS